MLLDADLEGGANHDRGAVSGHRRLDDGRHRGHRQIRRREGQHEAASAGPDAHRLRFHLRLAVVAYTAAHAQRSRTDFPALLRPREGVKLAFLDGPGGSQVPTAVIEAIGDFYASCNVNTDGNFPPSREVGRRMQIARETLATFLGAASADCISFGQNMTTLCFALSAAIGRTLKPGDEVLITQLDHEANRGPWLRLEEHGAVIREVRLKESGVLDAEDMAAKICARTKVFALGASSNALGTVNDVALARRLRCE